MRNTSFLILLLFFFAMGGCASFQFEHFQEPGEITLQDANRVHPHSRQKHKHVRLTLEQSQAINRLAGEGVNREGDFIAYYNARHMKPLFPATKGNIFLIHTKGTADEPLTLLVCTARGKVDEVFVKNNPIIKGRPVIFNEFLQQFIGRSLGHSWEIAENPEDLLSLPEKILPMSGYPETSKEIADAIRKVLVWAKVLRID